MCGLVLSIALLAACGAEAVSPSPTGAATTPLPTDAASPAPTVPDGILPPGVEFGTSTQLPGAVSALHHEIGGESLFFAMREGWPVAIRRAGEGWRADVIDDEEGLELPAGFRRSQWGGRESLGLAPASVTTGDAGLVVAGTGQAGGSGSRIAVGLIWHSLDGETWERFDPRTLLGGRNTSVAVRAVTTTSTGYIAAASVASVDDDAAPGSRIAVLRSTDGRSWSVASYLDDDRLLGVEALHAAADRIVLVGYGAACSRRLGFNDESAVLPRAPRAWQSRDDGATWQAVDLTAAAPVLEPGEPAPGSAPCPDPGNDPLGFQERFWFKGSFAGMIDGRLVVLARDGSATAASDGQLSTWTIAQVPGGSATAGPGGDAPRRPSATLLTGGTTGWILRSLQPRRDESGVQLEFGCDVRWWRSTDAGASWVSGIEGRPLRSCSGGFFSLHEHADGSVTLLFREAPVHPNPGAAYRTSHGGPVSDWRACTPGPGADCAFVTLDQLGGDVPVAWAGIDFAGASLTRVRLDGADLEGAHLGGAVIEGDLRRARLAGAYLGYATITGTLAGADLEGAQLFRTTLGGDLTGVSFGDAFLHYVTFLPGTTCPDGAPLGVGEGPVACRLP